MSQELIEKVEQLQILLISQATGGKEDENEFARLRNTILTNPALEPYVPRFLKTCRNLAQFWQHIKSMFGTYTERREYLWGQFSPLLQQLEGSALAPSDELVSQRIGEIDAAHVHAAWMKALERRTSDPEGAITSARTLIESVCKHILDQAKPDYDDAYSGHVEHRIRLTLTLEKPTAGSDLPNHVGLGFTRS